MDDREEFERIVTSGLDALDALETPPTETGECSWTIRVDNMGLGVRRLP